MRQASNHPSLLEVRNSTDVEGWNQVLGDKAAHFPDMPRFQPPVDVDGEFEAEGDRLWWGHSAKIRDMLHEWERLRGEAPQNKVIVFSQWAAMLDLLGNALREKGWKFVRCGSVACATPNLSVPNPSLNPASPT